MLSLALGAACAITLGACGGDEDVGEIPAESSAVMLAALEDARAAEESDPRECEAIADSASRVANEAAGLPESPVREAVIAAAENLDDLAKSDECGPSTTGPQGPANEDETTTPTTTPTPTATTTTEETTTTTTKEKEPAPKPKPQPPGEGNAPPGGTPPGQDGGGPDTGGTGGGGTGAG
jgi:hypothetical protein